ncbi:MAG: zinc-ribbon domain-containing protein [Desulfocapsa sp.]|nr:zinc-ribbon domain-containing protein [Desulfocapsa sp.]
MQNQYPHGQKVQKTFVKTNDTASIRCPNCDLIKNISVSKFRTSRHTFKIRCSCSHVFVVSLDFRRHYRKPTELIGTYTVIVPANNGGGTMQVNNISRSGIDFSVSGLHNIQVGQQIVITFRLDNKKETEINKQVIVRRVRNNKIGCEFTEQMQIGKDLGFYLRP